MVFDFGSGDRSPELARVEDLVRFYTFEWCFGEYVVLQGVTRFWENGQESERCVEEEGRRLCRGVSLSNFIFKGDFKFNLILFYYLFV
jgi:hypothetical protein